MSEERIVIDMPRWQFDNAVLSALEKDTGAVPIMGEIVRLLKIRMRKNKRNKIWAANFKGAKK